ncbi:gustatory receptor for sugar taste 64e-like [Agrilus planipennis]|uniref:Gustatory receptor for sugar taste 64e-like n=1 Tax=Agrilus planipennis TaxID=224129 RepID=A0A7F5R7X0_AGRPL|nr:gustatory receptor for sugar taste 64e-like [Agrilus planipennis]
MGPVVFNLSILCTIILFIKLSMKWPNLIKRWNCVDASFKSYGWPPNLDIRLKTMTAIVRVLSNFAWSYTDLFIGIISTPIALRFRQLCVHIEDSIKRKVNNIDFWKNIREDYNKLCILTGIIDDNISSITLLSFVANLYFILTQLFNTLRYREEVLLKAYYYASFFLLILRTVFVALYGAWINDESKNLCYTLHKAPASVYNSEISRFIDQIHFTEVALTGMKFFYVTRGVVLSMAGAIVTYELALIQFNENTLRTNAEINVTC